MKKTLKLCLLFVFVTTIMNSQRFEITPQIGYQINAKLNYTGGHMKIPGAALYGITGTYNASSNIGIEFSWSQQKSDILIDDVLFDPRGERNWGGLTVNNYQFGSLQYFGDEDDVRPFLGVSLGWSTFNPDNDKYMLSGDGPPYLSSTTTFTFGISGGMKYMFTDHIGVRVQSQLLLPVYGGSYYSYGHGYSKVFAMLNFTGGLIFGLGDGDTTTVFN